MLSTLSGHPSSSFFCFENLPSVRRCCHCCRCMVFLERCEFDVLSVLFPGGLHLVAAADTRRCKARALGSERFARPALLPVRGRISGLVILNEPILWQLRNMLESVSQNVEESIGVSRLCWRVRSVISPKPKQLTNSCPLVVAISFDLFCRMPLFGRTVHNVPPVFQWLCVPA